MLSITLEFLYDIQIKYSPIRLHKLRTTQSPLCTPNVFDPLLTYVTQYCFCTLENNTILEMLFLWNHTGTNPGISHIHAVLVDPAFEWMVREWFTFLIFLNKCPA